jgi:hypothetical protein
VFDLCNVFQDCNPGIKRELAFSLCLTVRVRVYGSHARKRKREIQMNENVLGITLCYLYRAFS